MPHITLYVSIAAGLLQARGISAHPYFVIYVVGVGVFGLVIPSLDFSDFIMRMAPLRKDYNQRIIKNEFSVDGDPEQDPDFGNTYDTYR